MNTISHLKGNFIIAGAGVGVGFAAKKFLKKEFIPVSSGKQMLLSFSFLTIITIIGKRAMDEFAKRHWVTFDTKGHAKVENEGFIGPLPNDRIIGPPNWA